MPFLYHKIPEKMRGNILFPLNKLKGKFPEIYLKENSKYFNRKNVKKNKILPLNCLWNDVIHLTPVHPRKISKKLKEIGFKTRKTRWYKINVKILETEKTTIYLYKYKEVSKKENFTTFDPKKIKDYNEIPTETEKYYKEKFEMKEKPLMFPYIPHILYKGQIDTRNLEKIEV